MKSLIVYYSHYGNTSLVVQHIYNALAKLGKTELVRLEYRRGQENPLARIIYKLIPRLVELMPVPFDIAGYDILCIGIPVFAGTPSSAITKYLTMCRNIEGKKIICSYVYGFEANAKHCARIVKQYLQKIGKANIVELFIPWSHVQNTQFVQSAIAKVIPASAGVVDKNPQP